MRIALGLEYDGSAFCGWQIQPAGCSVQDALERAIEAIAASPVSVTCAGRTDAGVHAAWQVVHFDAPVDRPATAWVRGVNAHLPPTVSILWARAVDDAFHSRFVAEARSYRYVLLPRSSRPGLEAGHVGWWHGDLDVDAMRQASVCLVGEHDFSAFRAAECQARSPVRRIEHLGISARGDRLRIDVTANAFLHHMIRNIVGSLVYVGAGRHPPAWIETLLHARDRRLAAPTFAPDGLYLTAVRYAPHWGLPAPAVDADRP